jgi:hypothetical protein
MYFQTFSTDTTQFKLLINELIALFAAIYGNNLPLLPRNEGAKLMI